jgi:hypothetical protein
MKKITGLFKKKKDTSEDVQEEEPQETQEIQVVQEPPRVYVDSTVQNCVVCGKQENLNRCKACKVAKYCCVDHQRQNWPEHKKACSTLKQYHEEQEISYEKSPERLLITDADIPKDNSVLFKDWEDYFFNVRKSHFTEVYRTLSNISDDQQIIDTQSWRQNLYFRNFTRVLSNSMTLYWVCQQFRLFDPFTDKEFAKKRKKKKQRFNVHILMNESTTPFEPLAKSFAEFFNMTKTRVCIINT